ncbi:MAG: sulfite exporter TauE/SafE family protein [Isosphaeraceae bacterium]|nr:sulfite exporter TauE/SafE family protein [Isosphaeraceae bacterium]
MNGLPPLNSTALLGVLGVGLVAGLLGGMFGIGGGLVIVPALIFFFDTPIKAATGTSMFAQIWPIGLLGVLAYWKRGEVIAPYGILIALGYFFGAYAGAKFVGVLDAVSMKRLYACFLLVMGCYLLWTAGAAPKPKAPPTQTEVTQAN